MENNNPLKTKSRTIPINDWQSWQDFLTDVATSGGVGNVYVLEDDIGTPSSQISTSPITSSIVGTFQGYFDGNDKTIYVEIDEDVQDVGLFRQIDGDQIRNLIIDGSVTGGPNSFNVGGLAGLLSSGMIYRVANLADITCANPNSSVGGIAGRINTSHYSMIGVSETANSGAITGGRYVAGIVGCVGVSFVVLWGHVNIRNSQNSGKIKSTNSNNVELKIYVAGIIAYIEVNDDVNYEGSVFLHDLCNIGEILGCNSDYTAGIVAYFVVPYHPHFSSWLRSSSNSGIVNGAKDNGYVGGIVAYLGDDIDVEGCINTNWIEPVNASSFVGAIVGFNNGDVDSCYYDKQMCIVPGIGFNAGTVLSVEDKLTTEMIGNSLQTLLPAWQNWAFQDNLYPRPGIIPSVASHPINLLSAAPIYLRDTPPPAAIPFETLDNVRTNFTVSNFRPLPSPSPPPIIPFPYQWGWYVGGFVSSSMLGYISVTPQPNNIAAIVIPMGMGGWDALAVRLMDDDIGFEKVIPINVRP